jgi:hypothetical protein
MYRLQDLICTLKKIHLRKAGEGVNENLLKSKKFHYAEIHRRMEVKTTLVRTKSLVEPNSKAPVDMGFSLVIQPRYSEYDHSFWLHQAL